MGRKKKKQYKIPKDALVILVGTPYSGKEKIAQIVTKKKGVFISAGKIRKTVYTGKNETIEREKVTQTAFFKKIEENLKIRKLVVADTTYNSQNLRVKLYLLAAKYKRPIRIIVMNIPLQTLLKINSETYNVEEELIIAEHEKLKKEYSTIYEEVIELRKHRKNVAICDIIENSKTKQEEEEIDFYEI